MCFLKLYISDYSLIYLLIITANGLAKLRGRLKLLSYQTAKKASRVNLFIF